MVNSAITSPDATNGQLATTYIQTAAQADSWKLTWQTSAGKKIHGKSWIITENVVLKYGKQKHPKAATKIQTQIIKKYILFALTHLTW